MATPQIICLPTPLSQTMLRSSHDSTALQHSTGTLSTSPHLTTCLAQSANTSRSPSSLQLCHSAVARQHSLAGGTSRRGKTKTSWRPVTAFAFLLPKGPSVARNCPRRLGRRHAKIHVLKQRGLVCRASFSWRDSGDPEEEECDENGVCTPAGMKVFEDGRQLFNQREFYKCHDVLEELWHVSPEPQRSVLHGILQCAVGLYHLQNQVRAQYI